VLRCMFLSSPAPACDPAHDNTIDIAIELVAAPTPREAADCGIRRALGAVYELHQRHVLSHWRVRLLRLIGSQRTRRWRELDSNHQFLVTGSRGPASNGYRVEPQRPFTEAEMTAIGANASSDNAVANCP
jgi:hypothetical protein